MTPRLQLSIALALLGALARPAHAQRISEIQISPPFLRMKPDAVTQLSATAYDAGGMPVDVPFRWASSNINIVTVDSAGLAHAVAPGNAVVSAIAMDGGRRRVRQLSIVVMRPQGVSMIPGPTDVRGVPMSPPNAPGMPMSPPTMVFTQRNVDSMIRASVNCNEPMINAVNPMRACWDQRATLRDSMIVRPELPGPDKCPQVSGVGILLQVKETGDILQVLPYSTSSCQIYTEAVVAMAQRLHFNPAMKDGHPVSAWVRLQIRGN